MNTYKCVCVAHVNAKDEDDALAQVEKSILNWEIEQTDSYCDDAATEVIRDRERN